MLGALQGGFTATATATAEAESKAKAAALRAAAFVVAVAVAADVALAFAVDVHPPLHGAEHRSDLWGQPAWMPAERGQAMDGLSARYPRDREKRRASEDGFSSSDAMPGALSLITFFARQRK